MFQLMEITRIAINLIYYIERYNDMFGIKKEVFTIYGYFTGNTQKYFMTIIKYNIERNSKILQLIYIT